MEVLDLRNKRCPMSLIMLKRYLLLQNNTAKINILPSKELCLFFSNQQAMQDIILYLDKKNYNYSTNTLDDPYSLLIQLQTNHQSLKV